MPLGIWHQFAPQVFFLSLVIVPRWNGELSIFCIKGLELIYHNYLITIRNHRAIHYHDLCPTAKSKFCNRVNLWTEHPLLSLDTGTDSVREVPSLQCNLCCFIQFLPSEVQENLSFPSVEWWRGSGRLVLGLAWILVEKVVVWQGTEPSPPPPLAVYRQD